jgi:hypothetical protein
MIIILDTLPVGLVSDALELSQYSDVIYSKTEFYEKEMITLLNNRIKRGELDTLFSMVLKIRPSMVQLTAMVTVMAMDTATVPIQTAMMMKEKLKQLCKKWS